MAKCIIDVDALKECLDFVAFSKINGNPVAFVDDVRKFIDKFPKDPLNLYMSELINEGGACSDS